MEYRHGVGPRIGAGTMPDSAMRRLRRPFAKCADEKSLIRVGHENAATTLP
jgi:hypothetical protein